MCTRHRDHANKEPSWILWLGDFAGGTLNLEDGTKVEGKGVRHKLNQHVHHWIDPHEGGKYCIVLYRGTRKQKSRTLADAMHPKRAAAKAHGSPQPEAQENCKDPLPETSV